MYSIWMIHVYIIMINSFKSPGAIKVMSRWLFGMRAINYSTQTYDHRMICFHIMLACCRLSTKLTNFISTITKTIFKTLDKDKCLTVPSIPPPGSQPPGGGRGARNLHGSAWSSQCHTQHPGKARHPWHGRCGQCTPWQLAVGHIRHTPSPWACCPAPLLP